MAKSKEISQYKQLLKERRFVVVPLDINLIGDMFIKPRVKYTFEGLPEDAIFVHADRDIQQQAFQFIYLHKSFEPVPEGAAGPNLYVTVTTIQPGETETASSQEQS